jgi:hypothetical protein
MGLYVQRSHKSAAATFGIDLRETDFELPLVDNANSGQKESSHNADKPVDGTMKRNMNKLHQHPTSLPPQLYLTTYVKTFSSV